MSRGASVGSCDSRADEENVSVVRRFHALQAAFYAGGPVEPLIELLADDVCWHVPGRSPIAGEHRGRSAVLAYFRRRRELAAATFRLEVREVVGLGDVVCQRVDGTVSRTGTSRRWETVGVLRVYDGRIRDCWLVPFDQDLFDEIWAEAEAGDNDPSQPTRGSVTCVPDGTDP